jgi:hypothetical protein
MTFVADAETMERKLRLAKSAAGSAVGNGCSPDQVRAAVEAGIREALALERGERCDAQPDPRPAATVTSINRQPQGSVLDSWAARSA